MHRELERCPHCGSSEAYMADIASVVFECGTVRDPQGVYRSKACELLEESVGVIHQLQDRVDELESPPDYLDTVARSGPIRAYFPRAKDEVEPMDRLRIRSSILKDEIDRTMAPMLYHVEHPEPLRLIRCYGPDLQTVVQKLANLREDMLRTLHEMAGGPNGT